ncbi:MAG TPA: class I tRNA ligase family protein, partial [Tepidisphaeraceae bacterium]|nr:class I tRNA ligase family protein [Tepidisphaeraceae bacterium]
MSTEAKPTESKPKNVYKDTLNLPQTAFPMEAKLVQNEPARLKKWQEMRLYEKLMQHRANAPKWILHDGPPFANNDIHIGHVTNKTLKDVFLRFKSLQGFQTPYVPGWDCHGLPIEHVVQEQVKKEGKNIREMSTLEIRQRCFAHAEKFAAIQSVQFQRLGILGEWDNPYMTMAPKYEASTLEVFADFVAAGLVYKQLKPVQWSIENQTALADAELEYQDVEDPSVYVEFPVENPGLFKSKFDVRENAAISYLIWTTTPWTLPANMAIAANPTVDYALVKYTRDGKVRVSVVAAALVEKTFTGRAGVSDVSVLKTIGGKELIEAGVKYTHPFAGRVSPLLPADYVTTTDGTGLVHTAGGHGEDDYATCMAHGVEIYCPVMAHGKFDATVPEWLTGLSVWEANPKIIDKLRELDVLLASEVISHSYPHDWRSKRKTISRATEQWFVALDKEFLSVAEPANYLRLSLRSRATRSVQFDETQPLESATQRIASQAAAKLRESFRKVESPLEFKDPRYIETFIPAWGRNRLHAMLGTRPDWCVSRQRAWGLPIPVFYNEQGEPLLTPESVRAVAKRFAEKGSDAWFTDSPAELLGDYDPGPQFPKDKLRKEKD